MSKKLPDPVCTLIAHGVKMPQPETVFIGGDVVPDRIAPGITIHPGCRLMGKETSVGPGCELGAEAPVTLADCQLGERVRLHGGAFREATFLNGAAMANGAYVRPGTLVEEEAGGAHTVGLKQTILFPYVVLGSLINFCDCLMAGGTSRSNHSEVGSSYIHFNYTPHQDKATASLIGDVPRGVMLDQPPIFLGGQGGLVGPTRLAFGTVVAAGTILRKDVLQPGLCLSRTAPTATAASTTKPAVAMVIAPYRQGAYRAIQRIVVNNLIYMGNINALRIWYRDVRATFMRADPFQDACLAGAYARLAAVWQERVKRLEELAGKMPISLELAKADGHDLAAAPYRQQRSLIERWPMMRATLAGLDGVKGSVRDRDILLKSLGRSPPGTSYLDAVRALSPQARAAGTAWLQSLVDVIAALWPADDNFTRKSTP
ncbi:MAG: UDP-N-acetylglucosamine pyrophosphorylase [Kiritimatiellae bacterium]|nr:UDP-N-acetylglucosamine pyrophosphorylase [Kiritimatiellia bacterium]